MVGATSPNVPFRAHRATCIVSHPLVKRDGCYSSTPTALHGGLLSQRVCDLSHILFLPSLYESMVMYGDIKIKKERVWPPLPASFFLVWRQWSLGHNCRRITVCLSRAALTTQTWLPACRPGFHRGTSPTCLLLLTYLLLLDGPPASWPVKNRQSERIHALTLSSFFQTTTYSMTSDHLRRA